MRVAPAALIVDDQPFVGLVASDILQNPVSRPSTPTTRRTRRRSWQYPEIELVVTDADLSGEVSGLELCRRVSLNGLTCSLLSWLAAQPRADRCPPGAPSCANPMLAGELPTLVAAEKHFSRRSLSFRQASYACGTA